MNPKVEKSDYGRVRDEEGGQERHELSRVRLRALYMVEHDENPFRWRWLATRSQHPISPPRSSVPFRIASFPCDMRFSELNKLKSIFGKHPDPWWGPKPGAHLIRCGGSPVVRSRDHLAQGQGLLPMRTTVTRSLPFPDCFEVLILPLARSSRGSADLRAAKVIARPAIRPLMNVGINVCCSTSSPSFHVNDCHSSRPNRCH